MRWFGFKVLRYCGLAKAHAWHILQAMAYNLKDYQNGYIDRQMQVKTMGIICPSSLIMVF